MTTKVTGSLLANTAVTAGRYGGAATVATHTVDAQGRLIDSSNVAIAITSTNLDTTGVTGQGYGTAASIPTFTVDTKGRITDAANVTIAITSTNLDATGVTGTTYGGGATSANFKLPVITVDTKGRITAASNVTVTSTSIYANTGQLVANAATGVVQIGLATSGANPGNYGSGTTTPVITVDALGRITSVSSVLITGGSAGTGSTTFNRTTVTATAGQTLFSNVPHTTGYLQVHVNGVLMTPNDYTANSSNSAVVLTLSCDAGDQVDIFAYTTTLANNLSPGTTGGSAGVVLYQSSANTTSNTAVGTSGYLLTSAGTGQPTWTNPATLTVSAATTFSSTSQNSQFNSIGVGTAASTVAGEIRSTGTITAFYSSDIKFKENIQDIPNALEKVDAIGGKLYDWTDEYIQQHGGEDGYFVQKSDFGVIAQDVQSVFPIATRTRTDGSLAVDYEKLCALAFAAIKELKSEVEVLKGQIK